MTGNMQLDFGGLLIPSVIGFNSPERRFQFTRALIPIRLSTDSNSNGILLESALPALGKSTHPPC
jgi:hypothetical protein